VTHAHAHAHAHKHAHKHAHAPTDTRKSTCFFFSPTKTHLPILASAGEQHLVTPSLALARKKTHLFLQVVDGLCDASHIALKAVLRLYCGCIKAVLRLYLLLLLVDGVCDAPHVARVLTCRQAYVSIRQHTSAYVSIRQHTSAYVSIRQRL
jgi:hypothetical protein